jgi:small subunit ribosomal protein S16
MLAIRLQRTGRKGYAQYRVIVQDAHKSPTSGRVVAYLGSYDPHAKTIALKKEKAEFYLEHGARPSERVAGLLKSEGVKLPKWVTFSEPKERTTRNPEKLRKNQPAEEKPAETEAEAPVTEEATEAPAEEVKKEVPSEEKPAEEEKAETPAETEAPTEEAKDEAPAEEATKDEKSEETK